MVKIPVYKSQGEVTTELGNVKSNFKVNPQTAAASYGAVASFANNVQTVSGKFYAAETEIKRNNALVGAENNAETGLLDLQVKAENEYSYEDGLQKFVSQADLLKTSILNSISDPIVKRRFTNSFNKSVQSKSISIKSENRVRMVEDYKSKDIDLVNRLINQITKGTNKLEIDKAKEELFGTEEVRPNANPEDLRIIGVYDAGVALGIYDADNSAKYELAARQRIDKINATQDIMADPIKAKAQLYDDVSYPNLKEEVRLSLIEKADRKIEGDISQYNRAEAHKEKQIEKDLKKKQLVNYTNLMTRIAQYENDPSEETFNKLPTIQDLETSMGIDRRGLTESQYDKIMAKITDKDIDENNPATLVDITDRILNATSDAELDLISDELQSDPFIFQKLTAETIAQKLSLIDTKKSKSKDFVRYDNSRKRLQKIVDKSGNILAKFDPTWNARAGAALEEFDRLYMQGFTDFEAMTVDILTRTLDVGSGDFEINMGIFIRPMWGIKKKVKDYTMKDIQDAKEATKVAATLKSPLPNIGGEYTNEMAIVELEKLNAMEAMLQAIQLIDEMNKDSQVPTGDEDNDAKNKTNSIFNFLFGESNEDDKSDSEKLDDLTKGR